MGRCDCVRLQTQQKTHPTKYAANSPAEDFAESVALYTVDSVNFRRGFPNRATILDGFFGGVTTVSEVQRVDEPTPNGGDYSEIIYEIIYMDDNFDVVDEDVATKCVIRECTADGSLVCETFETFS